MTKDADLKPQPRIVREAHATDLAQMLDLYAQLNPDDPPLPPERAQMLWTTLLEREGLHLFVVEQDGQLVATCTLVLVPNLTRDGRSYALIENVVTHASVRKQGHGRAVLEFALDRAWQAGCYKAMLLTSRKDEAIHRFYEGAGLRKGVKTGFHAAPADRARE